MNKAVLKGLKKALEDAIAGKADIGIEVINLGEKEEAKREKENCDCLNCKIKNSLEYANDVTEVAINTMKEHIDEKARDALISGYTASYKKDFGEDFDVSEKDLITQLKSAYDTENKAKKDIKNSLKMIWGSNVFIDMLKNKLSEAIAEGKSADETSKQGNLSS